jgi:hypothetical protein
MIGPYTKGSPDTEGHPNPSNTVLASIAGAYLKFVTWPGEPPL